MNNIATKKGRKEEGQVNLWIREGSGTTWYTIITAGGWVLFGVLVYFWAR